MKRKTTETMLLLPCAVIAAICGITAYFACSADDEFESNYEMETLAKGEMSLSVEQGTALFQGFYIENDGFAWINHYDITEYNCINSYAEWSLGWTGNIGVLPQCSPNYVVTAVYNKYTGAQDNILKYTEYSYVVELYITESSVSCKWDYDNLLHVYFLFKGQKRVYGNPVGTATKIIEKTFSYPQLVSLSGYTPEDDDEE